LLLLALLQVLPSQSAAVQELPVSKAERVWSGEPALLSAQLSVKGLQRQGRRDVVGGFDERADDPLDVLFALYLPLVLASAGFLSCVALACHFLLPVLARPGAPRGPPGGF
jgi:hypothetical protein